ncbi:MAG: hypothetical protein QME47_05025, partial [Candidatus Thermoplasmatota archaeon]|nr:hypothetical protein [Candidatus Thermoplasmatota archaeon]
MKWKMTFIISILAGILVLSALVAIARNDAAVTPISEVKSECTGKGLTGHAPIYIDGNAGFTQPDPVNGGGTGTAIDPYIIENWDINASRAHGIKIKNTDVYFIIRNCIIHDGKADSKHGIYFHYSINGKI